MIIRKSHKHNSEKKTTAYTNRGKLNWNYDLNDLYSWKIAFEPLLLGVCVCVYFDIIEATNQLRSVSVIIPAEWM